MAIVAEEEAPYLPMRPRTNDPVSIISEEGPEDFPKGTGMRIAPVEVRGSAISLPGAKLSPMNESKKNRNI
jgi:hypothetical protein